ncbi:hypothetical protein Scep_010056 [Stephania cephalantha]|uniref:Uncharacterized protein n=1 Tax=Stephania cephalantha TaxID=152367 RepID=A0AAP0JVC4_9MAGN
MVFEAATKSGDQRRRLHRQRRQRAQPAAMVSEAATNSGDQRRGLHKQRRQTLKLTRSSSDSLGHLEGFSDGLGRTALVMGIEALTVAIIVSVVTRREDFSQEVEDEDRQGKWE